MNSYTNSIFKLQIIKNWVSEVLSTSNMSDDGGENKGTMEDLFDSQSKKKFSIIKIPRHKISSNLLMLFSKQTKFPDPDKSNICLNKRNFISQFLSNN